MAKVKNYHENLEMAIQKLALEVEVQKKSPEVSRLGEKEIVKKSLQTLVQTALQTPASPQEPAAPILPSYLQKEDADPRVKLEVEKLVDMVFHKGLFEASEEAKKHPPFVEDAFHDVLVDKLLPELKKRGVL